jgi:nicotinamide-nucleotide amidase
VVDADQLDQVMTEHRRCLAVAESLTGGALTARLVAIPGSGEWLRGGVVAYDAPVKFSLLGVEPGCVITDSCASEMARGVTSLLQADVGLATTGVAGPEPFEDQPVGTVFVAAVADGDVLVRRHAFDGSPEEVRAQAVEAALAVLIELVGRSPCPPGP